MREHSWWLCEIMGVFVVAMLALADGDPNGPAVSHSKEALGSSASSGYGI